MPAWLPWAGAAVAALIVVGLTLLGNGGQPGTAGAGPSPAPSTQPTDARVRVRRADYLGTDATVAKQRLDGLGLTTAIKRRPNPGGHPQGDVAGIAPVGLVAPGETVVLTAWGAPPAEVGQPATTQPAPDGQGSGKGPEHGSKHGSKSQHGKAKGKK